MPKFFAISARNTEFITAAELKRLGALNIEPIFGGVHFEGDLELLYRANLWLRTSSRILMPLKEFASGSPIMLYDQVRRLKWENYLDPDKTFAVDCTVAGAKSVKNSGKAGLSAPGSIGFNPGRDLSAPGAFTAWRADPNARPDRKGIPHSHFAALKIKDAIVDSLRLKQGARPNVSTLDPDLRIHAFLNGGRCTLSLDSSGKSLHERGYRLNDSGAPLRETLAASLIELSEWDAARPFMDPMCGSGTLVIEAAMKALKIAPGIKRSRFGFMGWPDFNPHLWKRLRDSAIEGQLSRIPFPIVGYDHSREAIAGALQNLEASDLSKVVHIEKKSLETSGPTSDAAGVFLTNPPYGERIGDEEELRDLYRQIGDLMKQKFKGWTGFIFTGNRELAKFVGLKAARRYELFNGPIECRLLKYELY